MKATRMKICPATGDDCAGHNGAPCPKFLLAPIDALHFVGFRDDRYWNAVRAFGPPDIIHRVWDARAKAEVADGDVVIFAEGDEFQPVARFGWDDSHEDIIARGGERDR